MPFSILHVAAFAVWLGIVVKLATSGGSLQSFHMFHLNENDKYAILLSTLAGLSTTIGAVIAIVKRPGNALLAFLLGIAVGVMATLSFFEMFLRNALDNGVWGITSCFAAGNLLYYLISPFLPGGQNTFGGGQHLHTETSPGVPEAPADRQTRTGTQERKAGNQRSWFAPAPLDKAASDAVDLQSPDKAKVAVARSAELVRLGILMAVTMTLHNLPEGFAVAFSSFTDFGVKMAIAIALHNIPEGVIVAAPVYAATGNRWKALGIATASGLSEPLGALVALVAAKPFLTPLRLHYILAFVGGVMMAVCLLELIPEARRCRHNINLVQGIVLGGALMGITLVVGV